MEPGAFDVESQACSGSVGHILALGSKANGAVKVIWDHNVGRETIDGSLRDHTPKGINAQATQTKMDQMEEGRAFHSLGEVNGIDLAINLWRECGLAGSEFDKISLSIGSARETICSVRGAMCNGNMAADMMNTIITHTT